MTFSAGDVITAQALSRAVPQLVRLAADHTITSSTTKQSTTLTLNVEANSNYELRAVLFYTAGTVGDFAIDMLQPTGSTFIYNPQSVSSGTSTNVASVFVGGHIAHSAVGGGAGTGSANLMTMVIKGTFVIGSTAGSVTIRFAQNSSDATSTMLWAGSYLMLQRIN